LTPRAVSFRPITDGVGNLKTFPNLGRKGLVDGTREMVFASLPYIAVNRMKDNAVEILRVYHGAQDWP
jgi:toxin ParE1/3/4